MAKITDSIKVGTGELISRLAIAPVAQEAAALPGNLVSDDSVEYYRSRTAGGKVGLMVVEHCHVRPDGIATPKQLSIADDSVIEGFKRIADAVHKNGSKVVVQISHAGNVSCQPNRIGPSALMNPGPITGLLKITDPPREMTTAEVKEIEECYVQAARRVMAAGFDGIELHAAHGYLLSQFYSPLTNQRTDEYGGSLENRIRLHLDIIKRLRENHGKDMLLSMRFGPCDHLPGGVEIDDGIKAAQAFEAAGVDVLDVSGGLCGFNRPDKKDPGWYAEVTKELRKHISIPVILTGGIKTGKFGQELIDDGSTDIVGIARTASKDPNWSDTFFKDV